MKWAYALLVASALILVVGLASGGFDLTPRSINIRLAGWTGSQSAGSLSDGGAEPTAKAVVAAVAPDSAELPAASGGPLTDAVGRVYQGIALAAVSIILLLPLIVNEKCEKFRLGVTLVAYLTSSILMSLLNKALIVMSNAPYGVLIFQFVFAVIFLLGLFGCRALCEAPAKDMWRWGLLVLPFSGTLVSSLLALQNGTVTLLVVVRGIMPLFALGVERALRLKQSSEVTLEGVASLSCILVGVVLFIITDVQVNTMGLLWCGVNIICNLGSRVMERALLVDDSMNLSFAAMNVLNNLLASFPVSVLWLFSKEANPLRQVYAMEGGFLDNLLALLSAEWFNVTLLALSGVLGITVGWYGIAVQAEVTATTMAVFQAMSRVITVILATWLLGERVTLLMCAGFSLTILGSAWYKLRGERPIS